MLPAWGSARRDSRPWCVRGIRGYLLLSWGVVGLRPRAIGVWRGGDPTPARQGSDEAEIRPPLSRGRVRRRSDPRLEGVGRGGDLTLAWQELASFLLAGLVGLFIVGRLQGGFALGFIVRFAEPLLFKHPNWVSLI